ncbi:MAG: molybdopterin biosynthesis protein [Desulfurococcaceae archaeon]
MIILNRTFYRLVDLEEIEPIIEKYVKIEPLGVEEVKLIEALGRVLAEDIYAPIDYPPFDRSIVDGYAIRSIDVSNADELNPVKLRVTGSVHPGCKPNIEVVEGTSIEISTGAMIPRGSDAVVMVEYTKKEDNTIYVYRTVYPGENISTAGSDISAGDLILVKGSVIDERVLALLAGLGLDKVKVYVKPRIAIYSIGNEIVEPGRELETGKVYDINGFLITGFLKKMGLNPVFKGILPDDENTVFNNLQRDLEFFDILITSGGTSKGVGDILYRVLNKLGEPGVLIHGLKIKPGKPTVIAVVKNKLIFGLPGFPLSCFIVFHKIVKPIIARFLGLKNINSNIVKAVLPVKIRKALGISWFLPVALVSTAKGYSAYPLSFESGSLLSIIHSDGYCVIPPNIEVLDENSVVNVELFGNLENVPELNIIGSNDYLLYDILVRSGLSSKTRIIPTGSSGGWRAIERGEADIAPTHLFDPNTSTYNKPFIEKYGLSDKAVLIRGYSRLIGIMVAKGNPKGISSIEDFLREDIVIVNRTKGSGIHTYLEYLITKIGEKLGIDPRELTKRIKGYNYEVKTHTAVALAIKHGRADAGLGLGYVAYIYGLDFIPLTWEEFDFLVLKERLSKAPVKQFINVLRNRDLMERIIVNYRGYYKLLDDTGYQF